MIVLPSPTGITVVTVPALFVLVGMLMLAKLISVFLIVEVLVLFVWLLTISRTVSSVKVAVIDSCDHDIPAMAV